MLRLLDLFSGIGGFSLGLERSGAFRTVAFCEINPYRRAVLAKHWPDIPRYDDVTTLTTARLRNDRIDIDAICGGFPCQDVSAANPDGQGVDGTRSGLYRHIIRLVRDIRPEIVVLENVTNLLNRGIDRVLGDLASLGYDAEWEVRGADRLGATQHRERVWILAYPHDQRREGTVWAGKSYQAGHERSPSHSEPLRSTCGFWPPGPREVANIPRMADGPANRAQRLAALGDTIVPQIPEMIGRAIARAA